MHKNTARILGIKIKVCSCIEVAVCNIPMKSPIIIAVSKIGNVTEIIVHIAAVRISSKLNVVTDTFSLSFLYERPRGGRVGGGASYGTFVKLFNTLMTTKFQPSAMMNSKILNGSEIIIGGSIIIPIASSTLDTTMSTTRNGM